MASTSAATKTVERFLAREIRQKGQHITRFGPLPAAATTADAATTTTLQLPNPFLPRLSSKSKRYAPPKYSLRQQADLVKRAKAAGLLQHLPPGPKTPILNPQNEKVQKYNPHFAAVAFRAFEAQQAATKRPRLAVLPIKTAESRTAEAWTASAPVEGSILDQAVHWEGKIDLKQKAGADIGVKLYAGKKRMFKGHRWERLKDKRDRKRVILLRDMAKRIRSYKSYYKKKRPNPLKPAKTTLKAGKLPF